MLIKTSKEGIKVALEYMAKLPFAKNILHKITETVRGKCIVYFSLHRVLGSELAYVHHPHYLNRTAITIKQAYKQLNYIHKRLPFISLSDSLNFLMGHTNLDHSCAVLLIEVPYVSTKRLLMPVLEELNIPATVALSSDSIQSGRMPWMDEILFRLGNTDKTSLSVNFIDRSFTLNSMAERLQAAHHLIQNLSQSNPDIFLARLDHIFSTLTEVAIPPISERICTVPELEKWALNPLISFVSAGKNRLPTNAISLEQARHEIIDAQREIQQWLGHYLLPIYFSQFAFDNKKHQELISLMMDNGYKAVLGPDLGVCYPGDNMFHLKRLPLAQGIKSFQQFELQGLSHAIDEVLLVTLAKNQSLEK